MSRHNSARRSVVEIPMAAAVLVESAKAQPEDACKIGNHRRRQVAYVEPVMDLPSTPQYKYQERELGDFGLVPTMATLRGESLPIRDEIRVILA